MSENQALFERQLEKLLARFEELEHLLAGESGSEAYVERAREYTNLQEAVASIRLWKEALKRQEEAELLLEDPEFTRLAKSELEEVKALLPDLFHRVQVSLIPRDEADLGNAILEIRPAAGGEEAGLFAAQLFDAYRRFSEKNGWRFVQLSASLNDLGGLREGIAEIGGSGVFSRLKYESGVHRVQRVPATETQGRIHTSTVTVAVLPEAGEVDVDLRDEDLRIDVYRASGAGGQHVNKTESAVRVTHLPSGLVVAIQDEKSQHKNKAKALQVLRSRLYDLQRQKAHDARAADRKSQLGTGDRSERIRTYNFPQGRVTDHRINLTLYKIAQIMNGELDEIVDELVRQDQLDQLAGQMGSG